MDRLILISDSVAELLARTTDPANPRFIKLIGAPKLPLLSAESFEDLVSWAQIEENFTHLVTI